MIRPCPLKSSLMDFCAGFHFYWLDPTLKGQIKMRKFKTFTRLYKNECLREPLMMWLPKIGRRLEICQALRILYSFIRKLAQTAANLPCWNNVDISDIS